MKYNMIKGAELYRKYSYNIYKNRIIKLKVCPIDDKGFSFEDVSESNKDFTTGRALNTKLSDRSIKGYCKKLFPYHEHSIIKSYFKSENGARLDITGVPYKSYRRPQQELNNNDYSSKGFLPGMGVYIIDETAKSGVQNSTSHYNSITSEVNVPLIYSEYDYTTKFIGYVLGTSIRNGQEYNKDCKLK